ncbi:ISNCY-like element ISEnu1 family transposase [Endozoicomonas numazuensis]|uniref:ISNCY-like element ISEnu1 family transposase n=1 Tax=Endozoicomonas numazuensis TaxID=1137799 RepID=UPI0038B23952
MRQVQSRQLQIGEVDIGSIELDHRSRDDIPQILLGLQHLYLNAEARDLVFSLLEQAVPENISPDRGRPGMQLWKILVLGVLRLNLDWNYDRLREMANQHATIRAMLGHGMYDLYEYKLQTIKDNVSLLTPELLNQINEVVVAEGHKIVGKKKEDPLRGRCDSYVLETDVHFPTDLNLLFDAVRTVVVLTARFAARAEVSGWRQWQYNLNQLKKMYRRVQILRHSTSKDPAKKLQRDKEIRQACQNYLNGSQALINRAEETLQDKAFITICPANKYSSIQKFIDHGKRQVDHVKRRLIDHEKIPHDEKVFSLFQPHTEWINKGKAGVPVELGVRLAIVEDQYGFILNHRVMEKETDEKAAVPIIRATKAAFPSLSVCSFDKGFHSPSNQKDLLKYLTIVVSPKKGRRTRAEQERENDPEFKAAKRKHSAVESAINALESHGLDKCADHGIDGLKRYVALGVLARNFQKMGAELQKIERKSAKKRQLRLCG